MVMRRNRSFLLIVGLMIATGALAAGAHENPVREPVTVELTTDKSTYRVGETIRMNVTVCNRSSSTVTLYFHSYQLYDAVAYSGRTGRLVWRWSDGQFFPQALTSRDVAPGCTWSFPLEWSQVDSAGQQVAPGSYILRAAVTSHPAYVSNLRGVSITP